MAVTLTGLLKQHGAELCHMKRYQETYLEIEPYLEAGAKVKVLDVGGNSPFTKALAELGVSIQATGDVDLRDKLPIKDASYDLIVCTEVLEHIKDREDGIRHCHDFSGMLNMLQELRRVCKPTGHMFLSTPNVCSLRSLDNLIRMAHPFMYKPHVREMAPEDVLDLLKRAGWVIKHYHTSNCWDRGNMSPQRVNYLRRLLRTEAGNLRGDCLYVHAS